MSVGLVRCSWAKEGALRSYHDAEWGVPLFDERKLFELLILEGCQAGLSWETILKRRENYRGAYAGFDPATVAAFCEADRERLLADAGIIRNRAKIRASIENARAVVKLWESGRTLSDFLWSFVDFAPLQPNLTAAGGWPATTPVSDRMSKELRRLGFSFVGSTICYALMQSAGLTNDHAVECFRHRELAVG